MSDPGADDFALALKVNKVSEICVSSARFCTVALMIDSQVTRRVLQPNR